MAMQLKLQQKLAQQLVMTPQLQQAIKLLQLSHLEMAEVLQQELEENPTLEDRGEQGEDLGESLNDTLGLEETFKLAGDAPPAPEPRVLELAGQRLSDATADDVARAFSPPATRRGAGVSGAAAGGGGSSTCSGRSAARTASMRLAHSPSSAPAAAAASGSAAASIAAAAVRTRTTPSSCNDRFPSSAHSSEGVDSGLPTWIAIVLQLPPTMLYRN